MKKNIYLTLLPVLLVLSGCALQGPQTTGIITHGEPAGDGSDSIAALEQLAETDAAAAYDLGLRYLRGDGVPMDSYKGLQSLRAAGEHGDLQAQAALGKIYLTGLEEMGPDPMEASKWLRLAADGGDSESASLLNKAEAERKNETTSRYYGYPSLRDWYWHVPYRLHWRHGAWLPYW